MSPIGLCLHRLFQVSVAISPLASSGLPCFVVVSGYNILDGFSNHLTEVWSYVKVGPRLATLVLRIKNCCMGVVHSKHLVHHAFVFISVSWTGVLLGVNLRIVDGRTDHQRCLEAKVVHRAYKTVVVGGRWCFWRGSLFFLVV